MEMKNHVSIHYQIPDWVEKVFCKNCRKPILVPLEGVGVIFFPSSRDGLLGKILPTEQPFECKCPVIVVSG